jgi:Zn-dependent peptidase ImmA (M78 family)
MNPPFLTGEDLDRKALAHRRALGFRDDQPIDGMTLITKLKARYSKFNYRRIPDNTLQHGEAQWDSDRGLLLIPESIFSAMNRGDPRATMTILHEVGHMLLGHKGILHRGAARNRTEQLSARARRMELQARRYAAAFMMPNTPEVSAMTEKEIERIYHASSEAARIRKSELKEVRGKVGSENFRTKNPK